MMNTCFQCGIYRADKIIEPDGQVAICPACGYRHRFAQLPLLIVSGASGAGKSTVCHILLGRLTKVVVLDSDILWRSEFNLPEYNSPDFIDTWLRICKNISQSGRPVTLFGAGVGVPGNIEPRVERRYFAAIHYLALVCDEQTLAERLRRRPKWRGSCEPTYIGEHQRFNQWFKTYSSAQAPIRLLDTTDLDEETTANQVELWINEKLRNSNATIRSA